jgi:hypothetical protein
MRLVGERFNNTNKIRYKLLPKDKVTFIVSGGALLLPWL